MSVYLSIKKGVEWQYNVKAYPALRDVTQNNTTQRNTLQYNMRPIMPSPLELPPLPPHGQNV